MRFDQNFIEKVRDANNIVEIIGQYTELKAKGHNHMGLCPFPDHNEKTPSFSVSESKQLYYCFGCKKSGNIFTFLETYNGFSFREAVEYLASRAHIELPKEEAPRSAQSSRGANQNQKSMMYKANKFAAVFYHQKLKSLKPDHKLMGYLKKRNITPEIIEDFRIGYAPDPWDELTKYFNGKKVPTAIAQKLGLIRQNKKGGHFDLFRDRLMFPIFAIDGNVIGFGGRIIDQGQPKYINSVESDVFKKGQSFYGLDQSAKYIRSEDRVFVVEGYMDLIALYSRGVKNVVATLGTALTENHVKLIKRWTKNVVLLFDGDQAGQTASERSLIHFFKHDLLPQTLILPEGADPDDFISANGKEAFEDLANSAGDLFLELLKNGMKSYGGQPKDKIRIVDQVAPLLRSLGDQRLMQIYVEEVARRLDEPAKKVYAWIMGAKMPVTPSQTEAEAPVPQSVEKLALAGVAQDELALLGLSLKSLKYMDFFVNQQGLDYLMDNSLKELFAQIVAKYGQDPSDFDKLAHLVVSRVKNPEKIMDLINISSPDEGGERDEDLLKECFIRVKDRYLQRQASVLVTQMKDDPSEQNLERFVNIQNDRKALKDLKNMPLGE
ncbi:MAG: DNA primase [Pseudomonadota bacterium]